MVNEFQKTKNEQIWYPVGNFEKCIPDGENITDQSINVYDDEDVDKTDELIESGSLQVDEKMVIAKIIGGESGKSYKCRTKCTTNNGNIFEAIGYIIIQD